MEAITTLATLPAILALVNLLKKLGITGKAALAAAVVLGVALNLADYYFAGSGAYQAAATGLILGLGAAGVYDITANPRLTLNAGNTFNMGAGVGVEEVVAEEEDETRV